MEWEKIKDPHGDRLFRAKVPGGWLVKVVDEVYTRRFPDEEAVIGCEWSTSITFIPDAGYSWSINVHNINSHNKGGV